MADNRLKGSRDWRVGAGETRRGDDVAIQVAGYASVTSVNVGGSVDFHVSVAGGDDFRVDVYRLGFYGGLGARLVVSSGVLAGVERVVPVADVVTGLISCGWPVSWTLRVPGDWLSGSYVAVFTTVSGWRSSAPFVVREDDRWADLCVVVPVTTYQAYNQWPLDGRTGKSLYYGYAPDQSLDHEYRARSVSFDRPYSGTGQPKHADRDHDVVQFMERRGYDVTYATSIDLHAGRIDPARYAGLIFCGHDEYWSIEMRDIATKAIGQGTSLAFLTANNVYWNIRVDPSPDGVEHRVVTCYKGDPDPNPGSGGATGRWRDIDPAGQHAEQSLLGVQYNGIVATPTPLIVTNAQHWFWANCDVTNNQSIPELVGGEADGHMTDYPATPFNGARTDLTSSPYTRRDGTAETQNTSIYETPNGTIVFDAATLYWPFALSRKTHLNPIIQKATTNLLNRIIRPRLSQRLRRRLRRRLRLRRP